jgi:hypothetical protein
MNSFYKYAVAIWLSFTLQYFLKLIDTPIIVTMIIISVPTFWVLHIFDNKKKGK